MTCASCGHTIRHRLNRRTRYCDARCQNVGRALRRDARLIDRIMARRLAEIRRERNAA